MPEQLEYEELIWQMENCPVTYLPALLIRLNELVYSRKVLRPWGASRIAMKVEARTGLPARCEECQAIVAAYESTAGDK